MQPINESILLAAIRQCLETADHHIRQGNQRDARFYLDTADAYANRLSLRVPLLDVEVEAGQQ
jgi:hypothetical protein